MIRSLARAAALRCPRCGGRPLFRRWVRMVPECPGCRHRFEREEGYWLGAVAINTIATIAVFAVVLVGGMVLTWPDVPWTLLGFVTVTVNLVFPVLFQPFSKTLWVAIETTVHRPDDRPPTDGALG